MNHLDLRRLSPRVSIDGLCGVVTGDELRPATLRDLSAFGLRVERAFDPRTARRVVQLEIELPGIDEVIWARGEVTRALLVPLAGRTAEGEPRFWCHAGMRIAGIARREWRLLRDYVRSTTQLQHPAAS